MSDRPMRWADLPLSLRRKPDGGVVAAYRADAPDVLTAAQELAARGVAQAARDGRHPSDFFDHLASRSVGGAAGLR